MAKVACKVCSNAVRRPGIDAALAAGLSGAQIARDQTETGFPITGDAVANHKKHYAPPPAVVHPGIRGRDFAVVVRDKAAELFEEGKLDLSDKDHIPGINAGLKAQSELNKVAMKKDDRTVKIEMAILLHGGPPPLRLVGPGTAIEAEYDEVPSVDSD